MTATEMTREIRLKSVIEVLIEKESKVQANMRFIRIAKEAELAELRTKTPVCPFCEVGEHGHNEALEVFKCGCHCH